MDELSDDVAGLDNWALIMKKSSCLLELQLNYSLTVEGIEWKKGSFNLLMLDFTGLTGIE